MNELVDNVFNYLFSSGIDVRLIIIIIAFLPIAEARIAIPFALKCGLTPIQAFCYGFIGSSLAIPILLLTLIPLIKHLSNSKLFASLGKSILRHIDDKAQSVNGSMLKRMIGTAAFVSIPLPLTGVWTGSAIASILNIPYLKSLISITVGNLIASIIIVIISSLFAEYINFIMVAFALLGIIAAIITLVRTLKPKKSAKEN